jgi:hypothetical protein
MWRDHRDRIVVAGIAVITSIYGGYDQPAAPAPQDVDCDWLLVTDRQADCWPWKTIVEPRPGLHPRLAAKVAKCRPDWYTDADITIWVDGHVRIGHPGFVGWAAGSLGHASVAQLRHPQRQRIAEEAALSARLPKYAGQPVAAQAAHYLEGGFPDGWGLWAAGIIVRRTSPAVRVLGDGWLAEQARWSLQDQVSEAPLLWRSGVEIADLPGPLVGHWAFTLDRHADGSR